MFFFINKVVLSVTVLYVDKYVSYFKLIYIYIYFDIRDRVIFLSLTITISKELSITKF